MVISVCVCVCVFLYLGWYLGPGLSALPAEQLLLSRSVGRANRGSLDSHSPRSDYSSRRDFISSLARSRLSLVSLSFSSLSLSLSLSLYLFIYLFLSFVPSRSIPIQLCRVFSFVLCRPGVAGLNVAEWTDAPPTCSVDRELAPFFSFCS